MRTLSKGYKVPETPDRGSVFFPALEQNFERINSHNHDGVNAELIPPTSLSKVTQQVPYQGWMPVAGQLGTYLQDIIMPAGLEYEKVSIRILISGNGPDDGDQIHPTIERASDTSFRIYINDPIALRIIYA